ncbi:hypothetical protein Ddye_009579 [Dipteronia dyeriana]|uniref:CCHC-type domain-containing protein n=1 Tax=Dipteronia dyeriana TaxID=168575 RepID=A0AAD9XC15_9ROSI|nr:hypothetical protein Ddye_009579 [Dipteronia dyeriana]
MPKTYRNRELNEQPNEGRSGTVVCKLCSEPGHNKRTCKIKKREKQKQRVKNHSKMRKVKRNRDLEQEILKCFKRSSGSYSVERSSGSCSVDRIVSLVTEVRHPPQLEDQTSFPPLGTSSEREEKRE